LPQQPGSGATPPSGPWWAVAEAPPRPEDDPAERDATTDDVDGTGDADEHGGADQPADADRSGDVDERDDADRTFGGDGGSPEPEAAPDGATAGAVSLDPPAAGSTVADEAADPTTTAGGADQPGRSVPPLPPGETTPAAGARTAEDRTTESAPPLPDGGGEAPAPVPPPTASAFTDDRMVRAGGAKPERGWRRIVFAATGGSVNHGLSRAEQAHRELLARVETPISGCRKVAVVSRKGGVGKTTTTLMLGHTFARHRGDRVVALDGNPDAGSLGYRVRRETTSTVTSLLGDNLLERYADIRAHTSQAPSRLEVVASDDDPRVTEALGETEYRRAILQLERHYNLVMLDTGTGVLDSATQGILRVADQLVLVLAPSLDGARAASLTLDWLQEHGLTDLVEGSVAAINQSDGRSLVEIDRIEEHFAARCRATQRIPWDRHLGAGAESDFEELTAATRDAYVELAAKVADGFSR
jgi:putative peptide zinc metalloprotease protein